MRLMTYNILTGGSDADGDARLGKICELIRGVAPDILVLNECNGFRRHGFRNLYRVEQELGMRGVLATASTGFHVALFSRAAQILETHLVDTEVHHAILAARLELGGTRFSVLGAHLSPFGGDARLGEVQHLIRFVRGELVFAVGDLNSISPLDAPHLNTQAWLPRRRARHLLFTGAGGGGLDTRAIAALEGCDLVDTFAGPRGDYRAPTVETRLRADWQDYQVRIDYILASRAAAERVVRRERVDSDLAHQASDHFALYVDAEL